MKRFQLNLAMFAMLVAVTAAFAFKPVKKAGEVVYLLNAAGTTYTRFSDDGSLPDEGGCTHVADYTPCSESFNTLNDPGVGTFPATTIPANNIDGASEAYWEF